METDIYEIILLIAFVVIFAGIFTFIIVKSIKTFNKNVIKNKKKETVEVEIVGKRVRYSKKFKKSYIEKIELEKQANMQNKEVETDVGEVSEQKSTSSDQIDTTTTNVENSEQQPTVSEEDKYDISIVAYKMAFKNLDDDTINEYNVDEYYYNNFDVGAIGELSFKGMKFVKFVQTGIVKKKDDGEGKTDET
ncbi:MAG: hypothetical protein MJ236_02705 [Clostridia bacterium]|nr:hypothetical protein [Clostridia bacterium]